MVCSGQPLVHRSVYSLPERRRVMEFIMSALIIYVLVVGAVLVTAITYGVLREVLR